MRLEEKAKPKPQAQPKQQVNMRQEVNPRVLIALAALAVIVLGVLAWRFFAPGLQHLNKSDLHQGNVQEEKFK